MRNRWQILGLAMIAVLALVAFACADDGPSEAETPAEAEAATTPAEEVVAAAAAEAKLCTDLDTLQASVAAFGDLSTDSSIDDINAADDAFNDALNDVVSSAKDFPAARVEPIKDAYDNLVKAINDISSDTSISEALNSIFDELAALDAAYVSAFSSLDCS